MAIRIKVLIFMMTLFLLEAKAGVGYLVEESEELTKITLSTTLYFKNETGKPLDINFDDQKFNFKRYLPSQRKFQAANGRNYEVNFILEFAHYEEGRTYYPNENIIKIQEKIHPHAKFLGAEILNYNEADDSGDIKVKLGHEAVINPGDLIQYSAVLVHEVLHLMGLVDRYWHYEKAGGNKPLINPVDERFAEEIMGGINSQSKLDGTPISSLTHDLNFKAIIFAAEDFIDMGLTDFYIEEMINFDVKNLKLNEHWQKFIFK